MPLSRLGYQKDILMKLLIGFFIDDSWMFDASNFEWRKAPVAPQCRLWHTACRGLSREEIVVFGGCLTSIFEDTVSTHVLQMLVLQYCSKS